MPCGTGGECDRWGDEPTGRHSARSIPGAWTVADLVARSECVGHPTRANFSAGRWVCLEPALDDTVEIPVMNVDTIVIPVIDPKGES